MFLMEGDGTLVLLHDLHFRHRSHQTYASILDILRRRLAPTIRSDAEGATHRASLCLLLLFALSGRVRWLFLRDDNFNEIRHIDHTHLHWADL